MAGQSKPTFNQAFCNGFPQVTATDDCNFFIHTISFDAYNKATGKIPMAGNLLKYYRTLRLTLAEPIALN
jgi:hypothetical protein